MAILYYRPTCPLIDSINSAADRSDANGTINLSPLSLRVEPARPSVRNSIISIVQMNYMHRTVNAIGFIIRISAQEKDFQSDSIRYC